MKFDPRYIDKNGLVYPRLPIEDKPADNGILFMCVAVILGFKEFDFRKLINETFLEPGLIPRWKGNNFDQSAWDDYLAVAAICAIYGEKEIPKTILKYGIKHFFKFDTDGKKEGRDFLGRSIHVWFLMFCAAYPKLKYLMFLPLWLTTLFFRDAQLKDTSAFQLQWIFYKGCEALGFKFKGLKGHEILRKAAFRIYYDAEHPFNVKQDRQDKYKKILDERIAQWEAINK